MNVNYSAIAGTEIPWSGVELPRWIPMAVFDGLQTELTDIIGPIAPVVIEEDARELGYNLEYFPEDSFEELVERIAAVIPSPEKRDWFQQQVKQLI